MAAIECQIMQGSVGDLLPIRGTNYDGSLIRPKLVADVAAVADSDGWPYWQRGGALRRIETWGRLNWFGKDPHWRDEIDFRGRQDLESAGRA